ncbi:MAG: hypothetical protein IPK79_03065 [Vampirovibrionales bacterium]|nr:hypothetical protein [Vampirovibrionales bacterium]
MKTFLLILMSIGIGIAGQFCLKHGVMDSSGRMELASAGQAVSQILMVFRNPFIWFGLSLYAVGAVMWMMVLSRADISYAYPMLGIAYVIAVALAFFVRHEPVTTFRWAGVLLIACGVLLIGAESHLRSWWSSLVAPKTLSQADVAADASAMNAPAP